MTPEVRRVVALHLLFLIEEKDMGQLGRMGKFVALCF